MKLVDDGDVKRYNTPPGCMEDYYRELDVRLVALSEQSRPTEGVSWSEKFVVSGVSVYLLGLAGACGYDLSGYDNGHHRID